MEHPILQKIKGKAIEEMEFNECKAEINLKKKLILERFTNIIFFWREEWKKTQKKEAEREEN